MLANTVASVAMTSSSEGTISLPRFTKPSKEPVVLLYLTFDRIFMPSHKRVFVLYCILSVKPVYTE